MRQTLQNHPGAQRPVARRRPNTETSQGLSTGFPGYHATGHEGLEGALWATETSRVPLLEKALTKYYFLHELCIFEASSANAGELIIC